MTTNLVGKIRVVSLAAIIISLGSVGCDETATDGNLASDGVDEDMSALRYDDDGHSDEEDAKAERDLRNGRRPKIQPRLECVDVLGDGNIRAHWSYRNSSGAKIRRNIGYRNTFSPRPADRGQPTQFLPGTHHDVFRTTFKASRTLFWVLDGNVASAAQSSLRCQPGAAGSSGGAGKAGVGGAGSGGAGGKGGAGGAGAGGAGAGGAGAGGAGAGGAGAGGAGAGGAGAGGAGAGGAGAGGAGAGGAGAGGAGAGGAGAGGAGAGGAGAGGAGAGGAGAGGAGAGGAGAGGSGGSGVPGGTAACTACRNTQCTNYQGLGFNLVTGCFQTIDPQFGASTTDPTFIQDCISLMSCAYTNKCGFTSTGSSECFCGTASLDTCFATAGAANGACVSAFTQAARSTTLTDISTRVSDLAYPLGWANFLLECDSTLCTADCKPQ